MPSDLIACGYETKLLSNMERSSKLPVTFQNSGGETELVKSETETEQF